MNLLAIETSSVACSVALMVGGEMREKHEILENRHSRILLPYIQSLLAQAGLKPNDLDAVAAGNGPGSFTGLRLGLGVAQGLAYGLGLPFIPVSSLQGLAAQSSQPNLLVAVDARMGEVYWQCFRTQAGEPAAINSAGLARPEGILPPAIDGDWHGLGSGWDAWGGQLCQSLGKIRYSAGVLPEARAIATLAAKVLEKGGLDTGGGIEPDYVRNRVAELPNRGR